MANESNNAAKEEEERKRKAGAILTRTGRDVIGSSTAAGGAGVGSWLGTAALVGLGGFVFLALAYPDLLAPLMLGKKPVPAASKRWDDSLVYTIDGVDRAGKKASFDFVVKTKDYNWVLASADQLEKNGKALSVQEIGQLVFSPEVRKGLAPSPDVIAIGAASQEGNQAGEVARAEKRGRTAAGWLKGAVPGGATVWVLNLGQYRTNCSVENDPDTSWQRPFMFIGVRSQDAGVNLSEALYDAMTGKTNLPSTGCYSNFQLGKAA